MTDTIFWVKFCLFSISSYSVHLLGQAKTVHIYHDTFPVFLLSRSLISTSNQHLSILMYKCLHPLVAPYLVLVISSVSAVSTRRHFSRQVRVTWLCRRPEQLALVHEAFQSLVHQRGTVCRRKSRSHHCHSDSSLAG